MYRGRKIKRAGREGINYIYGKGKGKGTENNLNKDKRGHIAMIGKGV